MVTVERSGRLYVWLLSKLTVATENPMCCEWNRFATGVSRSILFAIALFAAIHPVAAEAFNPSYDVKHKFINSMFSTNGTLRLAGPLRYDKIVRWEMPIRIAFRGEVHQQSKEELVSLLNGFTETTPLRVVNADHRPNFIILFIADESRRRQIVREALIAVSGDEGGAQRLMSQLSSLTKPSPCAMASTNNQGRIQVYVGAVSIVQSSTEMPRCVELLAMAGVGFQTYDMSELYNRIRMNPHRLRQIQIDMVRLLYSTHVYPGQPFGEVRKALIGW